MVRGGKQSAGLDSFVSFLIKQKRKKENNGAKITNHTQSILGEKAKRMRVATNRQIPCRGTG
jgi:hypothetical protein